MKDCFDPRSYGAVADGHSKDTAAVQAAIDAAAAQGGTVRLAGGTFVCGTLYLKSNVALEITNSATLLASPDIADYGTDTHHNRYRNEPELDRCFLFAQDAENVTICGSGVIDGNAAAFPNAGSIYRPMLLRVLRCRNVRVQNLRLLNAAAWATAFLDSDFIWATDLHIENHRNYNGDGLDFDSCRHVWVRGCYIDGTDDNLCLQSSGGVLLNQCPHQLDLLQWLCGLPVRVHSFCHEGKWHDIEVEDDVTAYMEFANGATGVFITTTADAPGTNRLEITGTKGRLICDENGLTYDRLKEDERIWCATCKEGFEKPGCERVEVETDGENPQHAGVLNAFAAHIQTGAPLVADGREGINGLMLSNAIHLSSWLGETVTLPIDEEKFLNLLNERRAHSRLKEDTDVVMDTASSYGGGAK